MDHAESLEPYYTLGEPRGDSGLVRSAKRRDDDQDLVVRIVPGAGSERVSDRIHRMLRGLFGDELVEVTTRGDDLFLVWRALGEKDLSTVDGNVLTAAERETLSNAARARLTQWHDRGVTHGAFSRSGIRTNADFTDVWFVRPDLDRIVAGLQPSTREDDLELLEIALDPTWTSPTHGTGHSEVDVAPPGQEDEFRELLGRLEAGDVLLLGVDGSGRSTHLRAVTELLPKTGVLSVLTTGRFDGHLGWIRGALEELAETLISLPPSMSQLAIGSLRERIRDEAGTLYEWCPSLARVVGIEQRETSASHSPMSAVRRARLQLARRVFESVIATVPVTLVIDDATEITPEVFEFRQFTRRLSRRLHFLASADVSRVSVPDGWHRVRLRELAGPGLRRRLALDVNANALDSWTELLVSTQLTLPGAIERSVRIIKRNQWMDDRGRPTVGNQELVQAHRSERDPGALTHLLQDTRDFAAILSLETEPVTAWELECLTGASPLEVVRFIQSAERASLLSWSDDRAMLRRSVTEILKKTLSESKCALLHGQVADRLRAIDSLPDKAGNHLALGWDSGARDEEDRAYLVRHLERLLSRTAPEEAEATVRLLERLLLERAFEQPELEGRARLAVSRWAMARGQLEMARETLAQVSGEVSSGLHTRLVRQRVVLSSLQGDYRAACELGTNRLRELGVDISTVEPDAIETAAIGVLASEKELERACTEEPHGTTQELLAAMLPVFFVERPTSFPAAVLELINSTLVHGSTADSVRGLTTLAQLACKAGFVDRGIAVGKLALKIVEREAAHPDLPMVCSDLANFILPWTGDLEESKRLNERGRVAAIALGETQYAGYIRMHDAFHRLGLGERLHALSARVQRYKGESAGNRLEREVLDSVATAIDVLRGKTPFGDFPPTRIPLGRFVGALCRAIAALFLRDTEELRQAVTEARKLRYTSGGWRIAELLFSFVDAVACYRLDELGQRSAREKLDWEVLGTPAAKPLAMFVAALDCAARRTPERALAKLQEAIGAAESSDFLPLVALAAEEASVITATLGWKDVSVGLQRRAARAYHEWGAATRAVGLGFGAATPERDPTDSFLAGLAAKAIAENEVRRVDLDDVRYTLIPSSELGELLPGVSPVLVITDDLSEQRALAKAENATRELDLLKRLSGGLAHDVANLVMVVGAAFGETGGEAVVEKATAKGRTLARRLTAIASGKPGRVVPMPLDIAAHLRDGMPLLGRAVGDRPQVETDYPEATSFAMADPGVVDRILLNLLVNARQAIPSENGRVSVRVQVHQSEIWLEVEDNGPGIHPSIAHSLFRPGVTTRLGSGLGLAVVDDEAKSVGARVELVDGAAGAFFRVRFRRVEVTSSGLGN